MKSRKIGTYILTALFLGFVVVLIINIFYYLSLLFGAPGNAALFDDLMPSDSYAYGRWAAVFIAVALFSFFVLGFLMPTKKREWRSLGIYEAFIIALFTEMFGFPLTIYFLSTFLGIPLSFGHKQGHLLATMLDMLGILGLEWGWPLVMAVSLVLIVTGFILIDRGWKLIYRSGGELVTEGIYRYSRHPQYLGIILITIGLLIQWPTIITLVMWPILIFMYYQLAKKEEKEMEAKFKEAYREYKCKVPMFFALSFFLLPLTRLMRLLGLKRGGRGDIREIGDEMKEKQ